MKWPQYNEDLAFEVGERSSGDFVDKFRQIPYYLALWTEDIGFLMNKRVLDFGCGFGETAAGVAAFHQPASIRGVDINYEAQALASIFNDQIGRTPEPSPQRIPIAERMA